MRLFTASAYIVYIFVTYIDQAFTTSNQYGQTSQAETSNDVSAELIGGELT